MNPIVEHQIQPCPLSCVSTCLAMISGRPAEGVISEFHQPYRDGNLTLRKMLEILGVEFTAFYSVDDPALTDEGVYLCTAPSLNIQAGNHQILIEVTEDNYYVLDPVKGREDRKYLCARGSDKSPLAVDLGGFVVDAFISRKWLESR